jgi:hypothetical protein
MANEGDPWDWSIDEVVDEFCHSRTLWQQGRPNSALPDPAAFEQILRDNDVNGATLLTEVNPTSLKDDFGIKSLGQRSNVAWAVDKLRGRSKRFEEERPPPNFGSVASTSGHIFPYSFHGQHIPRPSFVTDRPTIYGTPPHPTSGPPYENHNGSTKGGASPVFASPVLPDRTTHAQPARIASQIASPEHTDPLTGHVLGTRRAGEVLIEDQVGRKKRRLDLASSAPPTNQAKAHSISGETVLPSSSGAGISSVTAETTTSGDADSTTPTKSKEVDLRSRLCGLSTGTTSFLGKNRFSADEMFFGSAGCGRALNPQIGMSPLSDNSPSPVEVFSYDGSAAKTILGRQSFINRKMMGFLKQPPEHEVELSNESLTFFPYSASLSRTPESRALIHIRENNGTVRATRERLSRLKCGENGAEADSTSSSHDWDYLAHWQHEPSTELALYNESDEEPDPSELDALEYEIREDEEEDAKVKKQLGLAQVTEIIDDVVAEIIRKWQEKSFPVLKEKALSIWRKGKTAKGRLLFAKAARDKVAEKNARLTNLKEEIMLNIWMTKKELVYQCQILDETVEQIEKTKFEMSVWKSPSAPPPPTGKLRTRKKRVTHTDDDLDEHMLDSDDEVVDDREDLEDFVDVDDLVPLDLTSMQESQESHDLQIPDTDIAEGMAIDEEQEDGNPGHESDSDSLLGGRKEKSTEDPCNESTSEKIKEEPLAPPTTSATRGPKVSCDFIDLTIDSDEEDTRPTQSKQAPLPSQAPTQSMRGRSSFPDDDPDTEIAEWDWFDLEEEEDRIRIIIKLIRTMPTKEYQRLREYVVEDYGVGKRPKIYELAENVQAVLRKHLKQNPRFSLAVKAYKRADELLHLYVCWLEKAAMYFRKGFDVGHDVFELVELEEETLKGALATITEDDSLDLGLCLQHIYSTLEKHAHPLGGALDDDEVVELDQADIGMPSQSTPHKRRKRQIAESQFAVSMRRNVQKNAQVWDNRTRQYLSQNRQQSSDLGPAREGIVVNTGKEEEEPEILVDHHIAGPLKSHQIEGIRFMWREIVGTSSDDQDETQGCLLAHTMGLGKTFQV